MDMAKVYGEIIPPDIVLDASDVPKKDEIVERLKQAQLRREQMEAAGIQAQAAGQRQPQQKKRQLVKR